MSHQEADANRGRCATCVYWFDFDAGSTAPMREHSGQCRRYPPQLPTKDAQNFADDDPAEGVWPLVAFDAWCGEYEA